MTGQGWTEPHLDQMAWLYKILSSQPKPQVRTLKVRSGVSLGLFVPLPNEATLEESPLHFSLQLVSLSGFLGVGGQPGLLGSDPYNWRNRTIPSYRRAWGKAH